MESIRSRGPDAQQVWEGDSGRLGHTRLSVIDLDSGAQPMSSGDGKTVIVFNGEIYNYQILRKELTDSGFSFGTQSDTEVLLKGYLAWGREVVNRLDGIFAFAIYDLREGRVFLARDRCGIKPLFYQKSGGYFGFGSTLGAVTGIRGESYPLDYVALQDYLAFETVLAPRTILTGVAQLEPAHCMTYDLESGALEIEKYWELGSADFEGSFEEALEMLDGILKKTFKDQMVADVPLGAFLSGGIDSSLATHYLAEHSSSPLLTFSVAFGQAEYDESKYAREVAEKYQTDHHVIPGPEMTASMFEESIASLDQPLADPAYPLTWFLSRVTKREITVAISGDGADELFGGYDKFNRLSGNRPRTPLKGAMNWLHRRGLFPGAFAGSFLTGEDWTHYKKVSCGQFPGNRKDLSRFLVKSAAARVSGRPLAKWLEEVEKYGGHDNRMALMKADFWTYLSENCLVKTDRASMASGLEVRVPFLGNEVVDFALKMPDEIHFKGRQGKQLLRGLARRHLPESVWNRKKHGFSIPLGEFFEGPWGDLCGDLFGQAESLFPPLDGEAARRRWQRAVAGKSGGRTTYALAVLLLWARNNSSVISF